jgi:hypothetical protein
MTTGKNMLPVELDFFVITCYCVILFYICRWNINRKWIS